MIGRWALGLLLLLGAGPAAASGPAKAVLLDDFEDPGGWTAHPADGVELSLHGDAGYRGRGLRFDFRFQGGGYAVARKAVAVDLPENYAFSFRLRGECLPNHLEFKLLDESGENVWWHVERDKTFPEEWQLFTVKKRHIQYAWGPLGGGEIRHVAAIEIVVTAGQGGAGSIWIDDLELRPLPPPGAPLPPPTARATSTWRKQGAEQVLDGDPATAWIPKTSDEAPAIRLDFGGPREFGGIVLRWLPELYAVEYVIETSDDGKTWRTLREVKEGNGGQDPLFLPESEAAHLRLRLLRAKSPEGPALAELEVKPLEWAPTRAAFFETLARAAPRGLYPRAIAGEQSYWTVAGADGDTKEALLGEDGALEIDRGGPSVEPFLYYGGKLRTWNDARITQSLEDGDLPIPSVRWDLDDGVSLTVTALAVGRPESSAVVVRYRVESREKDTSRIVLYLAVRPFQVNPPAQMLNLAGGPARIRSLVYDGSTVIVNNERRLHASTPIDNFGAVPFDGGDVVAEYLVEGRLPRFSHALEDPFEACSGALAIPLLGASGGQNVDLIVSLHPGIEPRLGPGIGHYSIESVRAAWRERLDRVTIDIPAAPEIVQSLRAQLGYILVNRAGPAIQPGTRSYARSWIRDGALTSSALLRMGLDEPAREFLEWFAPHQYPSGKIPCVVDARGADPVPEHDSSGEFIFLVAEVFRYTGDRAPAETMWPRVERAAAYLDSLRRERRGPEWQEPGKKHFYGLLPPSISHEGYSAKPMHSYWDDFFALRGWKDTVFLATALGKTDDARRWEQVLREFSADLAASVRAAMEVHGIDYVPGCADMGDFDATSTTIALSPVEAEDLLPPGALARTFDIYDKNFRERAGGAPWDAYTPYEIRNVGAFVRLGRGARANELLDYFLADQRPSGWKQWPEVVWHDARTPRFLGDLPHTWVGSDYVRSVLDLLAYPRYGEEALVIGAGILPAWTVDGVRVAGLPTPWGPLTFEVVRDGDGVRVTVAKGLRVPPGGLRVRAPAGSRPSYATVNRRRVSWSGEGEVLVRSLPATVRFVD